jgi:sporulation protein YlmC with PRC-barrel domain
VSTAGDVTEGRIPLVLRLLDHQIVGADGDLLGNVDDLELAQTPDGLLVVGILSGPPALAARQGGRTGAWLTAVWRRLHPDQDPHPLAVPLDHVTRLDSAVHVSARMERVLEENAGLELWLRDKVVSRLPGALDRPDGDDRRHTVATSRERHEELACADDALRLSRLLGVEVLSASGERVGRVVEATAEAFERRGLELGRLRIVELVSSNRHLGEELGYTMDPQGPVLLRVLLRWWHRGDRRLSMDDVEQLDWRARRLVLSSRARPRHPHDT